MRSNFFRTNKKLLWVKKGNRKLPKNPFYQFFKVTHFYFTHNSTFWGLTPCTNFGDALAMSTVKRRDQFTVNSENHVQFTYVWYVLVHKVENKSSLMSLSWHMVTFFLLFELLLKVKKFKKIFWSDLRTRNVELKCVCACR